MINSKSEQNQKKKELNARRRKAYAAKKQQQAAATAQPQNAEAAKVKGTAQRTEQQIIFSRRIQNEKMNLYRIFGEDKDSLIAFINNNVADEQKNAAVRLARRDALRWASPAKACPF